MTHKNVNNSVVNVAAFYTYPTPAGTHFFKQEGIHSKVWLRLVEQVRIDQNVSSKSLVLKQEFESVHAITYV